MALVTAVEFCFSTPRIDMHRCVPSQTTATPSGAIFSWIVSAICSGQALLQLQPPREDVDEPGDLAEPDDSAVGDVRDVTLAEERQQVVLAQTVVVDVAHDYHFTVVDREQRAVQDLDRCPPRTRW